MSTISDAIQLKEIIIVSGIEILSETVNKTMRNEKINSVFDFPEEAL